MQEAIFGAKATEKELSHKIQRHSAACFTQFPTPLKHQEALRNEDSQ